MLTQPSQSDDTDTHPGTDRESSKSASVIEIDPEPTDSTESYTHSLKSFVTSYKFENGRRYHAYREGEYMFPNDERESDRLDFMHHILTLRMEGRLHLAPLGQNINRVLDIGTGTGIWAIEMGDTYPQAEIIGNDLSPIQPDLVPENVYFEVDDIESEWAYSHLYSYIHCRYMASSISDWPRLVANSLKYCEDGGWVEFQEPDLEWYSEDGSLTPDHAIQKWSRDFLVACNAIGKDPSPGPKLRNWMHDAGFVNLHEKVYKLPIGAWPKDPVLKEIGAIHLMQFLDGIEAFTMGPFTRVLGLTNEQAQAVLINARKDVKSGTIRAIVNLHVVFGQKPFSRAPTPHSSNLSVRTH
jgi:SAM-dependent methyltransferase